MATGFVGGGGGGPSDGVGAPSPGGCGPKEGGGAPSPVCCHGLGLAQPFTWPSVILSTLR